MKNNKETRIQWLQNELKKDEESLNREKLGLINEIKKFNKQDLIPKPKKITLWERIKTILKMS
jgi:hypothetical protein